MQLFISARLQLTAWYLLIILTITVTVSSIVYFRTAYVIEQEYSRIEQRIARDYQRIGQISSSPQVEKLLKADLFLAKRQILLQLTVVNVLIALLFTIAGYGMSGKTLRPIQQKLEEQQRLLADAAHELKTPVTALKTSLEVNLMDSSLPKQTKQILRENLEDVRGLETLTEGLLTLARVGHRQLDLQEIELDTIVEQSVKRLLPLAAKQKIDIKVTYQSKSNPILGDSNSLIELMQILLDNAIKYSKKNSTVTIALKTRRKQVELHIVDTGIGIPKEHLPFIFDRFYRVDSSRTKSVTGGFGLGLAVAKKITELHKGNIFVKSIVNKGTTITLCFPKITRVVIE